LTTEEILAKFGEWRLTYGAFAAKELHDLVTLTIELLTFKSDRIALQIINSFANSD